MSKKDKESKKYKYLVTIMAVLNRNNFETVEINATELK